MNNINSVISSSTSNLTNDQFPVNPAAIQSNDLALQYYVSHVNQSTQALFKHYQVNWEKLDCKTFDAKAVREVILKANPTVDLRELLTQFDRFYGLEWIPGIIVNALDSCFKINDISNIVLEYLFDNDPQKLNVHFENRQNLEERIVRLPTPPAIEFSKCMSNYETAVYATRQWALYQQKLNEIDGEDLPEPYQNADTYKLTKKGVVFLLVLFDIFTLKTKYSIQPREIESKTNSALLSSA